MKCLPYKSKKKVYNNEFIWRDNYGNEKSFNDQPSWVFYDSINKIAVELEWRQIRWKKGACRYFDKPCYFYPQSNQMGFPDFTMPIEIHLDYLNKDFEIVIEDNGCRI